MTTVLVMNFAVRSIHGLAGTLYESRQCGHTRPSDTQRHAHRKMRFPMVKSAAVHRNNTSSRARPEARTPRPETSGGVLQQLLANPEFLIRRVHQLAAAAFVQSCSDLDLTPSQYAALFALRQQQTVSQNELGRLIALDRSTTSVVLRSLKQRQLVLARADASDKRKTLLSLTEAGHALLTAAEQRNEVSNAHWLGGLSERQSAQFLNTLRRLAGPAR